MEKNIRTKNNSESNNKPSLKSDVEINNSQFVVKFVLNRSV